MNGIVINVDPVMFWIGSFPVGWYGFAIMIAVLAAVFIAVRESKRKGIPADEIYTLIPVMLMIGLVGARLFHVVDQWQYYASNPEMILHFQHGGLAIWGGIAGGGLAMACYAKVRRIPLGQLADVLVPALIVAQIIGRVGCIINGDAYGGITDLPWGFVYTHPDSLIPFRLFGESTHPYPVYEMLWNGLVLMLILRLRHRLKSDGLLFFSYISFYALGRLILSFVRQENVIFWGLQQAQLVALAILFISLAVLIYRFVSAKRQTRITEPNVSG
jgi:phosphatidylglycerol:prolipoprotein diacylglycerol transferase